MSQRPFIDPETARARGTVSFPEIPLNAYQVDLPAEVARHGNDGLTQMLRDMICLRQFEVMLHTLRAGGVWQGVTADFPGPAYLGIGHEAAAVGQAAALGPADLVFGSHRAHPQVLATALSVARQLPPATAMAIMEQYFDGAVLRLAETLPPLGDGTVTTNFVLVGLLAEVFGRRTGFNHGLAGAVHAFFPPFGLMPNNAIVGGAAGMAVGAALYKRVNQAPGIVVANLGDAASVAGPVWEAMTFAAMDQFRQLWPAEAGGHPPILFSFLNDFTGLGGQTVGETTGFGVLARLGAGVDPAAMQAERVDGHDPLAVANAVRRKKEVLLAGDGPILLDIVSQRLPDPVAGLPVAEAAEGWQSHDGLTLFAELLIGHGIASETEVETWYNTAQDTLGAALRLVTDDQRCAPADPKLVESITFSGRQVERFADRAPSLLQSVIDNSRFQAIGATRRRPVTAEHPAQPDERLYTVADGLFEALVHRFAIDPTLSSWGQAVRQGGAHGVYRGLSDLLDYPRLFNTAVAESAMVGAGIGYALCGGRAVIDIMSADFLGRAGDELLNQIGGWQCLSGGLLTLPLVIRVPVGADRAGAQLARDWSSLVAGIPGLKAYYPVTPTDAKGMLNLALAGTDPVVVFESTRLYGQTELFETDGVPTGYYTTAEGQPALRRPGGDLTIATLGPALYTALAAADRLADVAVSAEVIDLRFLVPLDLSVVLASLAKTGRLVLVSEAPARANFLDSVAEAVTAAGFADLDAPVCVVAARSLPAVDSTTAVEPGVDQILDVIHQRVQPLSGYQPTTDQSPAESLRRWRVGG